jgi:DNA-binding NarL/FixJ family response regulator
VRTLASGGSILDPAVTGAMVQKLVALATSNGPDELSELTDREREVLVLVARGKTNREIANDLVISEATARNHISHIFEKLGLSRRSEAAALAVRLGLG